MTKNESFFSTLRKRFESAQQHEAPRRKEAEVDTKFRLGEQWPDNVRVQRQQDGRPALTFNRIPEVIAQVENEARQQRFDWKVLPVGEGDEAKETAEVLTDFMRAIQRASKSRIAINTALKHALTGGFGWLRVGTEYAGDDTLDQDIVVLPVMNQFSVYVDPASQEFDFADMRYAFVVTEMAREEFTAAYPKAAADGAKFFEQRRPDGWSTEDTVRVAEYFYVTETQRTLVRTVGGQDVLLEEAEAVGVEVIARRAVAVKGVHYCKTNGYEILEEGELPGSRIPLVPVFGDVVYDNGKAKPEGIVRHARDPQNMINYWLTSATEKIALSSRAPWVGAEGQFEGHAEWGLSNVKNYAFLEYKPVTAGGQLAPPPQRVEVEPAIQGMVQMFGIADQHFRSATRMYAATLGDVGPEQSGRAILARKNQANIANLNYTDNLLIAMESLGKIILEMIPLIYNAERLVSILAMDGADRQVWLNKPFRVGAVEKIYDVRTGRYHVTMSAGPSYETKRQEAAAGMIDMAKADPALMQTAPDLVYGTLDWPGAQEIAERRKKLLPPELRDEEEDGAIPPQAKAALAQLQQQNQMLVQALQQATSELERDKMKIDSAERMKAMDLEVKLLVEEMKAQTALMHQDMASVKHRLDLMFQADGRDQQAEQQMMASETQAEQA